MSDSLGGRPRRPGGQWDAPAPRAAIAEQPLAIREHRQKPTLVTGAAGFLGTRTCAELTRRGWKIRALVRDPVKAAGRLAAFPVELRVGDVRDREAVRASLAGVGAVIHLAAIAIERGGESYEDVNTAATRLLLDEARVAGVTRIIFVSQNGASASSRHRFVRSKGAAEELITSSDLRWTVLRPSLIFGRDDAFTMVLARAIRLIPLLFPLPAGGTARFQPVFVDDVAQAIAIALDRPRTVGQIYAVGGPLPLTLRQMTERILLALDARRLLVPAPLAVLRPVAAIAARLLARPPVTPELLALLVEDNVVTNNALRSEFGIVPTPFAPEELLYLRAITAASALRSLLER